MTKKNEPKTNMPPAVEDAREQPVTESLPTIGPFIGWTKTARGWVVLELHVEGDRVVDRAVLHGPDVRLVAEHALKLAFVRKLLALKN